MGHQTCAWGCCVVLKKLGCVHTGLCLLCILLCIQELPVCSKLLQTLMGCRAPTNVCEWALALYDTAMRVGTG